jgi:hypothetical protein
MTGRDSRPPDEPPGTSGKPPDELDAMLDSALGGHALTPQEEMLKRYVSEVIVPAPSKAAPTPALEPDPLEGVHLAWQHAYRQLDQAVVHYLDAKRALGSARDTGVSLGRALERHDETRAALETACDHCAQMLARLQSCAGQ